MNKLSCFIAATLVAMTLAFPVVADSHRADLASFLGNYGNYTLPPPWNDNSETPQDRLVRIRMIADVVAEQAPVSAAELGWYWSSDDLALAAFTKMWHESGRFRLKVHNGTIRGDNGRSVCLGQIMYGGKRLVGTDRDSTKRCITEVMRHLITHQRRCLNEVTKPSPWAIAKVFAGYGTGHSCKENVTMPANNKTGRSYWARERSYTWWQMRKASVLVGVHR